MTTLRFLARAALPLLLIATAAHAAPAPARLRFTVNLNDRADTLFKVSLRVDKLTAANDVFQFAATAPGTYQVMDIGRFVHEFHAYDAAGRELSTSHISTNQWKLSSPERVREVRYTIEPTWTTHIAEHRVYRMCGSSLSADHSLMNGQALFVMPHGMQAVPISVKLLAPRDWKVSTSLRLSAGQYLADDYDQLVDSPILAGRLSTARMLVTGVPVDIAVYSTHDKITATQLSQAMRTMLNAAGAFLGKLPVDRYTFLYTFEERGEGAWEHSYGSEYALQEADYTPAYGKRISDIAAHEFFHVVTPLNLHSEIIEHFNFETPVPSQHLWLYEGSTEWAAQKMHLESGLKTADEYLATVVGKMKNDRAAYDSTWSLTELAVTSYSDSGQRQYGNIYMRGAVVAGLLDIKLLQLSHGEHGLRDLIQDLSKIYGKKRAFTDDSLFDVIAQHAGPEVADFLQRYVRSAQHLPVKEYYDLLGITLVEDEKGAPLRFEMNPNPTPDQAKLRAAWLGKGGKLAA
ncbi:MAG: peptidase [Gemmatimonadota bacterium]